MADEPTAADLARFDVRVETGPDGVVRGSARIGDTHLYAAGLGPASMYEHAQAQLDRLVLSAKFAFCEGNPDGLRAAVALWAEYRSEQPMPDWILRGILRALDNEPAVVGNMGCHAQHDTKRRDYFVDYIRAEWIRIYAVCVPRTS